MAQELDSGHRNGRLVSLVAMVADLVAVEAFLLPDLVLAQVVVRPYHHIRSPALVPEADQVLMVVEEPHHFSYSWVHQICSPETAALTYVLSRLPVFGLDRHRCLFCEGPPCRCFESRSAGGRDSDLVHPSSFQRLWCLLVEGRTNLVCSQKEAGVAVRRDVGRTRYRNLVGFFQKLAYRRVGLRLGREGMRSRDSKARVKVARCGTVRGMETLRFSGVSDDLLRTY